MTPSTTTSSNGLGSFLAAWSPRLLSVLRIVAGLLFMQHGAEKLFGIPTAMPNPISLFSLLGLAGILEFFGGLLVALGLFTRPVAFILSGEMAVAFFDVHIKRGIWPILNGGDLAVLFCFAFLYLAAAGGGAWSLDNLFSKRVG